MHDIYESFDVCDIVTMIMIIMIAMKYLICCVYHKLIIYSEMLVTISYELMLFAYNNKHA